MNESNLDDRIPVPGVTPFPEEPYELALVLYETSSVSELEVRLQTDVDESLMRKWNLTREQYREELLFAKQLIEYD